MALITRLQCHCGIEYCVYVPKRVLYKEIFGDGEVELGKLIDEDERHRGEIVLAEETVELSGFGFRDISVNEVIQCECGRVFDMLRIISLSVKYPDMGVLNYEEVRISQYDTNR